MTSNEDSLGGRLPLLKPDALDRDQRKLYDAMEADLIPWAKKSGFQAATDDGRLIGPFNPLLYSPKVGEGFLAALSAERSNTSLSATVREVVILSVGAVWQSAYELYAHRAVAEKAGLSKETIEALADGRTPDALSDDERVAHEFARGLAAEHRIDPALYPRAVDAFGKKGVVDMIHLVSLYMATSALLNVFAVPTPED